MRTILDYNEKFYADNPEAYQLLEYWPTYVEATTEMQSREDRFDSPSLAGFTTFMTRVLQDAGVLPVADPRDVELLSFGEAAHALAQIQSESTDEPTVIFDTTELELINNQVS